MEQTEVAKQKQFELTDIQRQFATYKEDMDIKLMKKDEIIRKFGDRWNSLETDVVKKEEELKIRLAAMDTTQKKVIDSLKEINNIKTNTIDKQKEYMEKQIEKIEVQEDLLDRAKEAIWSLSEGLNIKERAVKTCLLETREQKEHIEGLEKEISLLYSKVNHFQLEALTKLGTIKILHSEVTIQNEKLKELEVKLSVLEDMNNELEAKNRGLEAKTKTEEECLENVRDNSKKIEGKTKQIETLKIQIQHLDKIKEDLAKAVNQNVLMKKELEEKNREIKQIHKAANLKEQIMKDELKLSMRDEAVESLSAKWQTLEQAVTGFETQCKAELKNAKNHFTKTMDSKNVLIESLIASEKQAIGKLSQSEETVRHLEKESTLKEIDLLNTEKQMDELKEKLEGVLLENSVLQFQLFQAEASNNEELDNIEAAITEQMKLVNEAYLKLQSNENDQTREFTVLFEVTINKQLEDLESSMKLVDVIEESVEQLVQATGEKVEACSRQMVEHKDNLEALQIKVVAREIQNGELKDELVRRDRMYDDLKHQMIENLKLLQNEILKSEIGPNMSELGINTENGVPSMECMLRQIHTRNVVMKELREEVAMKHDALVRIQERYQRLSDKIKRVTIAVTDAKVAYEDLERENRKLRESLRKRYADDLLNNEGKSGTRKATKPRTILETFGAYNVHVNQAVDMTRAPPCHLPQKQCPPSPSSPPVDALCEELKSIKKKNKTNILKLGFQKDSDNVKSADQNKRNSGKS